MDNIPITAGAGTTVATEEIGGVHYQKQILAVSDGADEVGLVGFTRLAVGGDGNVAYALSVDIAGVPVRSATVALANELVVGTGFGILLHVSGYNSGPAQFIQIHDAAASPAPGAVPDLVHAVGAASNFDIEFSIQGRPYFNGIRVRNSTTPGTLTAGAANCWITAESKMQIDFPPVGGIYLDGYYEPA